MPGTTQVSGQVDNNAALAESDRSELERALIWLRALEYSVDDLSDLPGRGSFDLLASLGLAGCQDRWTTLQRCRLSVLEQALVWLRVFLRQLVRLAESGRL